VRVAVVAHYGKTFGGGLAELRRVLDAEGVDDLLWFEVGKSRKAPPLVRRAVEQGAELVFAWGGDGMVQRCVDVLAGSDVALAVLPAGTANLFASNLDIPTDVADAVAVGLRGRRRRLDVGTFDGEKFAVMAGVGFDASMIRGAGSGDLKNRLGRAAYVWSASTSLRKKPFKARVKVEGVTWYKGKASCILLGNLGELFGGVKVFEDAQPDDGKLDVAVVTADGLVEWGRVLGRLASETPSESPFAHTTQARSLSVSLNQKVRYELDGGDRTKVKHFKAKAKPGAITVCVPLRQTS